MSQHAEVRSRRSLIFVPGIKPAMLPKAMASAADVVCLDLEDSVTDKDKEAARNLILSQFENDTVRAAASETELVVRG